MLNALKALKSPGHSLEVAVHGERKSRCGCLAHCVVRSSVVSRDTGCRNMDKVPALLLDVNVSQFGHWPDTQFADSGPARAGRRLCDQIITPTTLPSAKWSKRGWWNAASFASASVGLPWRRGRAPTSELRAARQKLNEPSVKALCRMQIIPGTTFNSLMGNGKFGMQN